MNPHIAGSIAITACAVAVAIWVLVRENRNLEALRNAVKRERAKAQRQAWEVFALHMEIRHLENTRPHPFKAPFANKIVVGDVDCLRNDTRTAHRKKELTDMELKERAAELRLRILRMEKELAETRAKLDKLDVLDKPPEKPDYAAFVKALDKRLFEVRGSYVTFREGMKITTTYKKCQYGNLYKCTAVSKAIAETLAEFELTE